VTPGEEIEAYAAIADALCARIEEFVARGSQALKQSGYELTTRDHVMIGLTLKIDSSFRAFLVDARAQRVESLHHLKTMVEAFIYLHVVSKDRSDRTAEGLLCKVYQEKERFYRLNPTTDFAGGLLRLANKTLAELTRTEGTVSLGDVGPEAHKHSPELGQWYEQVYRSACEPAHVTDLLEFVEPFQFKTDPEIVIGNVAGAVFRVATATNQGLQLMFSLAAFASDNVLKIHLDVDDLLQRAIAIRSEPTRSGS
jgi:hypothetical protein